MDNHGGGSVSQNLTKIKVPSQTTTVSFIRGSEPHEKSEKKEANLWPEPLKPPEKKSDETPKKKAPNHVPNFTKKATPRVAEKASKSYEGLLHTVSIRLRQSMSLKQVDFFGFPEPPKDKTKEFKNFEICLMVKEGMYPVKPAQRLQTFFPEAKFRFSAWPGKDICLTLLPPVVIPALVWVDILFEIKGPATMHLPDKKILVDKILDTTHQYQMDIMAGSSRQLKALHFEPQSI